jgi:hypothetical protein
MKLTAALVVLASASISGICQSQKDDPGGWNGIKWGTSRADVETRLPDAKEMPWGPEKFNKKVLTVPDLNVAQSHFLVRLFFSKANEFQGARLESVAKPTEPSYLVKELAKVTLLGALTDKYGNDFKSHIEPEGSGGGLTETWQWMFPSTSITLTWTHYRAPNYRDLDSTSVAYSIREKLEGI